MERRRRAIAANSNELRRAFRKGAFAALLCLLTAFPVWCQSVPEFYGIYANIDGKLTSMIGGKGNFTPSQASLQVLDYYNGNSGTQHAFVFQGSAVSFVVFDAAAADVSATVELYKLPYARSVITRPDAVGGLLGQISGHTQGNPASPLQEYVVAKTDELKMQLLQKPVAGQPQMIQLVPASNLDPGIYCLFAIRNQGGQTMIYAEIFEWNGGSGTAGTQFCIDMLRTGGFGGLIEDHDARLEHPYFLAKDNYAPCSSGASSGQATSASAATSPSASGVSAAPAAPDLSARKLVATCNNYAECFHGGMEAYQSEDWEGAIEGFKAATGHNSTKGESWVWLGRAYLGAGHTEDFSAAWDKALALGTSISVDLCRQRGIAWCERGTLLLDARTISFAGKSQLFSATPSEVTAHGFEGNSATMTVSFFKLKVSKKDYTFDPVPVGIICEAGAAQLTCPPPGVAQQMAIGIYVLNAIPKLASGAFAKPN